MVSRVCEIVTGEQRAELGPSLGVPCCRVFWLFSVGAPAHLAVGGQASRTVKQVVLRPSAVHLVLEPLLHPLCRRLDHIPRQILPPPPGISMKQGDRHGPAWSVMGAWR